MNYDPLPDAPYPALAASEAVVAAFFRRVYLWMTIGLSITGLVAFAVATSPLALGIIFGSKLTFYAVLLSPLAIVLGMSFLDSKINSTMATGLFLLLSVLYGLTFSAIFLVYTGGSIARAFLVTAGGFGALSVYGMVTKRNLSGMGQFFLMGVVGLIIAGVVNIFLASDALSFAISIVAVVVFAGLTVWKTNALRNYALANGGLIGTEEANKAAAYGALSLYLSFINLFMAILRLTGSRR